MLKVSPGIEPGLKDSKSLVIPLHHETKKMKKYITKQPFLNFSNLHYRYHTRLPN